MPRRSKTAQEKIDHLYATLATIAARRAVTAARNSEYEHAANRWAEVTEQWLDKTSANAIRWTYTSPSPSTTL